MKVKTLTKPNLLQFIIGRWYVVKYLGAPMTIETKLLGVSKVYPVKIFTTGTMPLPADDTIMNALIARPTDVLIPANMTIDEIFAKDTEGRFYLLAAIATKQSGGKRFNVWSVSEIELDEADQETLRAPK